MNCEREEEDEEEEGAWRPPWERKAAALKTTMDAEKKLESNSAIMCHFPPFGISNVTAFLMTSQRGRE